MESESDIEEYAAVANDIEDQEAQDQHMRAMHWDIRYIARDIDVQPDYIITAPNNQDIRYGVDVGPERILQSEYHRAPSSRHEQNNSRHKKLSFVARVNISLAKLFSCLTRK